MIANQFKKRMHLKKSCANRMKRPLFCNLRGRYLAVNGLLTFELRSGDRAFTALDHVSQRLRRDQMIAVSFSSWYLIWSTTGIKRWRIEIQFINSLSTCGFNGFFGGLGLDYKFSKGQLQMVVSVFIRHPVVVVAEVWPEVNLNEETVSYRKGLRQCAEKFIEGQNYKWKSLSMP